MRVSPGGTWRIIKRSDLGRHLIGEKRSAYETRGNPGDSSLAAFTLIVEQGAIASGRDKNSMQVSLKLSARFFAHLKEPWISSRRNRRRAWASSR
jgi:hypothetical protein